jgi:hypothetical protein
MSVPLKNARNFLESLQRFELSMLLNECSISIESVSDEDLWIELETEKAIVSAPAPIAEALRTLQPYDRKRIGEAIAHGYGQQTAFDDIHIVGIERRVEGSVALLADLLIHRAMMISVATDGDRIQDVNDYYRARETRIREQMPSDIPYDNPHKDLWAWYHHWRDNFGRWAERRQYVNQLIGPAIDALAQRSTAPLPKREASGWERVVAHCRRPMHNLAWRQPKKTFKESDCFAVKC